MSAILFLIYLFSNAQANEVIDLGGLEVQGELRQPSVRFYQSERVSQDVVKEASQKHFEDFEKKLLKPVVVGEIQKSQKKEKR